MKRVEPSFEGSVSVTGAPAATWLPWGWAWPCAGDGAGARQTSAPAVNNEARIRLMTFSTLRDFDVRLRQGVGHEIYDQPVLPVHQQHVAPDVTIPHLLR